MNVVDTAPVILFFKAHVGPYLRRGKLVNLAGYQGKQARAVAGAGQMDMFGDHPTDSAHASGGNWQMPIKDAIKEHKELIHAAETPSKADDKREVEKQREELGRMEGSQRKQARYVDDPSLPHYAQTNTIYDLAYPIVKMVLVMADNADSEKEEKALRKFKSALMSAADGNLASMKAVEKAVKMKKFAAIKSGLVAILKNGALNLMDRAKEAVEMTSALNGGRSFQVSPEVKEMYDKWASKSVEYNADKLNEQTGMAAAKKLHQDAVSEVGEDVSNEYRGRTILNVIASNVRKKLYAMQENSQQVKLAWSTLIGPASEAIDMTGGVDATHREDAKNVLRDSYDAALSNRLKLSPSEMGAKLSVPTAGIANNPHYREKPYASLEDREDAIDRLNALAAKDGIKTSQIRDAAEFGASEKEIEAAISRGEDAIDALADMAFKRNGKVKQGFGQVNSDKKYQSAGEAGNSAVDSLLGSGLYNMPQSELAGLLKHAKVKNIDAFERKPISERKRLIQEWMAATEAKPLTKSIVFVKRKQLPSS